MKTAALRTRILEILSSEKMPAAEVEAKLNDPTVRRLDVVAALNALAEERAVRRTATVSPVMFWKV